LQHAKVGLANAANLAAAPGLPADPFNGVVKILLLGAAEKFEPAAGTAAAPHVHVDISVALFDVPLDSGGPAPTNFSARRKAAVVATVGCCPEWQSRIRTSAIGTIYAHADRYSVTDIDLNDLIVIGDPTSLLRRETRRVPVRNAAGFDLQRAQASVFFTRSAVMGRWRSRLPVSWNTALAIAGATATTPISPMPLGGLSEVTILV
jgi:hypothetical protein